MMTCDRESAVVRTKSLWQMIALWPIAIRDNARESASAAGYVLQNDVRSIRDNVPLTPIDPFYRRDRAATTLRRVSAHLTATLSVKIDILSPSENAQSE